MQADYILTTFAPAMFGEKATTHIRLMPLEEAQTWVTDETRICASKISHERLAKRSFPAASDDIQRFAQLTPGRTGVLISYRGPPIPDTGEIPPTGLASYYLIEVEDYQD